MITRPLDLQAHLKRPSNRINPIPLFDVLLIALFFSVLGSNFVLAPGLTINLPRGNEQMMAGLPTSAFLTVQSEEVLLFEGRILNLGSLGPVLEEHVQERGETNLVIYVDRDVSVQTLLAISGVAREAGVTHVQVAAEPQPERQSGPVFPEVR